MEEKINFTIKQWAEDDRPREKMLNKGVGALSNAELLAILIGSGTQTETAVDLAKRLLQKYSNDLFELGKLSPNELAKQVKGIGKAKAVAISAALELGKRRRLLLPKQLESIKSSTSVAEEFYPIMSDLTHEEFWVLLLNKANKQIGKYKISSGGISSTIVDSRIILKYAIENLASNVVLVHNHPSGSLSPSRDDIELTKKIIIGCKALDIIVLDHIIIGQNKYYSFSDEGLLR
ncbi:MAG: DNA repair protein RadC [Paludibacteraceae bacterium]|nr:DNA repair protein RadC [Paludibacteraceae bacterium]MBR6686341.1 DNA repair protein RadC [Paludibacteraceae bacterium]